MWGPLKNRALSETLSLKRPLEFFSILKVPIRYWVLNGEDLTNVDGRAPTLHNFASISSLRLIHYISFIKSKFKLQNN